MTARYRNGVAIVYVVVGIVVFFAFVSLAVDYGRVQLAKTQLRDAADAAALAGATQLGNYKTVQNLCVQYAANNICDGTPVQVDPKQDIDFLIWDPTTRTYTVLPKSNYDYANAVRVWCRRITSRNNPISLMFARVLGRDTCDVSAYSIAAVLPPGYAIVGLNYINLQGEGEIASYWASDGSIAGNGGNVASNGNITLGGDATIRGTIWDTDPSNVFGGKNAIAVRTLSQPLSYPNPTAPSTNNNANIIGSFTYDSSTGDLSVGNNQTATLPGGTYVFNNVNVSAGGTLNVSGPTVIYYSGNFNMGGNTVTAGNDPGNLTINAATINGNGPGSMNLSGTGALYANVMAPQADITIGGNGAIYTDSVVGKSIATNGGPNIYYDLTSKPGSVESVRLVDVAPVPR